MLELNKLYNMDCMRGMKEFPDGFFDLAIVDPPYGIGIEDRRSAYAAIRSITGKSISGKAGTRLFPRPNTSANWNAFQKRK